MLSALVAGAVDAADYLLLSDFTLIDGTGTSAQSGQSLLARDGVIIGVGSTVEVPEIGAGDVLTRLQLKGAFVMPGLIDTHVHVARFPTGAETSPILAAAIRGGITTVRDLGGDARILAAAKRGGATGEMLTPTIVYSGLYGGPEVFEYGPISQLGDAPGRQPWLTAVTPGLDLRMAVARTAGTGAAGIKIYGNLSRKLTGSLVDEAGRQGLMTWAHATVFTAGPSELVDAGVDSLSHAPYLVWAAVDDTPADFGKRTKGPWDSVPPDHPKLMALYDAMAEQGVYLDATLYVYDQMQNFSPDVPAAGWARQAFEWGVKATALAHDAGVPITVGTDWFEPTRLGELPHTHDELALLVKHAGLSPLEAIVAGTRNGAAAAGVADERGTLEAGKAADLLVLDADPLGNIHNTRRILRVIKGGQIVR